MHDTTNECVSMADRLPLVTVLLPARHVQVCEWDEWAYEEMLVEATVVEGRGYLEVSSCRGGQGPPETQCG